MEETVFREYLSFTDWYVSRKSETGKEIPLQIIMRREYARKMITTKGEWASDFDLVFGDVDAEYKALLKEDEIPEQQETV